MRHLALLFVGGVLLSSAVASADPSLSTARAISELSPPLVLGATGGLWAADLLRDSRVSSDSRRTGEAVLYTGAATLLLKRLARQPRPDTPESRDGFPSGHTALAFAFARSLAERDSDWAVPAYAFAAAVAWSRVKRKAHTPTQVVAGAALGLFVAGEVWER